MNKIGKTILLIIAGILFVQAGCKSLPDRMPKERDGKLYGVTEGPFRFRWWNYYERALSFADGEFWREAELDLLEALDQRSEDSRKARIYGRKFVEYYPHRELGVTLFRVGRLEEAVRELTLSLGTVKSARAEYYLDRARKALIERDKTDRAAPEIIVHTPKLPCLTNALSAVLRGEAVDDTFVREIRIDDKKLRVDVSEKSIPFRVEIPVESGKNEVSIRAVDLSGRISERKIILIADHMGPALSIEQTAGRVFDIYAFDDSGVDEIVVGEDIYPVGGKKEIRMEKVIRLPSDKHEIRIAARDIAGNVTEEKTPFNSEEHMAENPVMLAVNRHAGDSWAADTEPAAGAFGGPPDDVPPDIELIGNKRTERITSLGSAVIEARVADESKIESIRIDGGNILGISRKKCRFNVTRKLKNGLNAVTIWARDIYGNSDTVNIRITRVRPEAEKTESRLRMAVVPFEKNVANLLKNKIRERRRFVLKDILPSPGADEDDILETAGKKGVDCVLFGTVAERNNTVTIETRIKDPEFPDRELVFVDAYSDNAEGTEELERLSGILDMKLTDELPVVKGTVTSVEDRLAGVDIGAERNLKEKMKILIYETGDNLLETNRTLGRGRLKSVMENSSVAVLDKSTEEGVVRPNHLVITR